MRPIRMTHCAILLRWVRLCLINLKQRCPEGAPRNLAKVRSEQGASERTVIFPIQYYKAN